MYLVFIIIYNNYCYNNFEKKKIRDGERIGASDHCINTYIVLN